MSSAQPITRDDIEAKFREIKGDVDETVERAKPMGLVALIAVALGAIGLAYLLGRRKERKRRTVVEIKRV
jgi:hypothetical protein